jgi:bifunctional DNA-binding transcriptional regulator/antitoxin component of YhaV-PrlF toxin-antitoxin module
MNKIHRTIIDDEGGLIIPKECLAELGIKLGKNGKEVVLIEKSDGLLLIKQKTASKRHSSR